MFSTVFIKVAAFKDIQSSKNLDFNDSRASIWFKSINTNTDWAVYSEALTNSQYYLYLNHSNYENQLAYDLLLNGSFPASGTLGQKLDTISL